MQSQDLINIISVPINELVPYENNPRDNEDSVPFVMNSIQQFGFKVPMVVQKDNVLATGHTRLKACKRLVEKYGEEVPMLDGQGNPTGKYLNLTKLPCVLADDLDEDQIKAYRIADNKAGESSKWNGTMLDLEMLELGPKFDMSMFGFPMIEVETKEKKDKVCTVESMEIKAFEHWDYIVFVFDNQMDWLNVVNEFGIHKVNAGYGTMKKVGVGRVINGKRLLEALRHPSDNPEQGQE